LVRLLSSHANLGETMPSTRTLSATLSGVLKTETSDNTNFKGAEIFL